MGVAVVTGASGFVGRRVVERLATADTEVVAIARSEAPPGLPANVRWVRADLLEPSGYSAALSGADVVIHLAAVTGKAWPHQYKRNNVEATEVLLGACERAGVRRFVFASSIAAKFGDRRFYPYAASKVAAEEAVRASSLETTIIRPTMIFGAGSPVEAGLARLARLPIVPIFGDGRTRVAPIHVADVVAAVVAAAEDGTAGAAEVDVGGARVLTIEELVLALRAAQGISGAARVVHLPLGLIRFTLAVVERLLLPVLPLTAGQLATFANDAVPEVNPFSQRWLPAPTPIPALAGFS